MSLMLCDWYKSVMCIRPVFSRVDKKRGTYRVKESVHLNRPTVEPNRIRKHNGRRVSANGDIGDQPTGNAWAMRRNSTQVLQLGEFCQSSSQSLVCLLVTTHQLSAGASYDRIDVG